MIATCSHSVVGGTKRFCHVPLLCEYCLNLKRAEVIQCLLDHLRSGKNLFCTIEEGSYSFLRGVYRENGEIHILNNAPARICNTIDLSDGSGMIRRDIQDVFNDTLEFLEDAQKHLIDWKQNLRFKYQQRASYLGGVLTLYHRVLDLHMCSVDSRNIFFWSKPPKDPVQGETQSRESFGNLYSSYQFSRKWFQLKEDEIIQKNQNGTFTTLDQNLFKFLCSVINVKYPWLAKMGPEELAYHLKVLGSHKTFQRIGPIFSGIGD